MGVDPQGIDLWIFGSTMIGKCGKYLWEYDGYNGHDLGIYILSEREREIHKYSHIVYSIDFSRSMIYGKCIYISLY